MRERPILFSAPMVRAILDGSKTQTRRAIKGAPSNAGCSEWCVPQGAEHDGFAGALFFEGATVYSRGLASIRCPYGQPGDRLWVRETWAQIGHDGFAWVVTGEARDTGAIYRVAYRADGRELPDPYDSNPRWRPSIHMPRWASRLTLDVLSVRVERLHDISEEDARAEGVGSVDVTIGSVNGKPATGVVFDPRMKFAHLWQSINGAESWAANPWVWVVEFKRVENAARAA